MITSRLVTGNRARLFTVSWAGPGPLAQLPPLARPPLRHSQLGVDSAKDLDGPA